MDSGRILVAMNEMPDGERTARHPIGVVVDRTGLTPDVVRVWERRYGAVRPARGAGGHRLYSDADIARIRLLSGAVRAGRSIGQVASLDTAALVRLAEEDAAGRPEGADIAGDGDAWQQVVDDAFAQVLSFDARGLGGELRRALSRTGLRGFVAGVLVPLLRRIGDGWHLEQVTIAQEHLASAVIQDILLGAMRAAAPPAGAACVVIGTPEGERHEIGAAMTAALAASDGWAVIYLGADLPAAEIAGAAAASGAEVVAVSIVHADDRARMVAYLKNLRTLLPDGVALVAGGAGAVALSRDLIPGGIRVESGPLRRHRPHTGDLSSQSRYAPDEPW